MVLSKCFTKKHLQNELDIRSVRWLTRWNRRTLQNKLLEAAALGAPLPESG